MTISQASSSQTTAIRLYQAFYGKAPGNGKLASLVTSIDSSGASPVASSLAADSSISSLSDDGLTRLVLTNLNITPSTVTKPGAYYTLLDSIRTMLGTNGTSSRGEIVLAMTTLLAEQTSNNTWSAAAKAYLSQTSSNFDYSRLSANTADAALGENTSSKSSVIITMDNIDEPQKAVILVNQAVYGQALSYSAYKAEVKKATSVEAYTAVFDSLLSGRDPTLLAKQVLNNLLVITAIVGDGAYQMELNGLIGRYRQKPQSLGKTTHEYSMERLKFTTDPIFRQVARGIYVQGLLNYNYSIQTSSTGPAVLKSHRLSTAGQMDSEGNLEAYSPNASMIPVLLDASAMVSADATGNPNASAKLTPTVVSIPKSVETLPYQGMTPELARLALAGLEQPVFTGDSNMLPKPGQPGGPPASPGSKGSSANSSLWRRALGGLGLSSGQESQRGGRRRTLDDTSSYTSTYHTPAQIRSIYKLPELPSSYTGLSAAQAAALGAGQTIYITAASSLPYISKQLDVFNAQFGLPSCTVITVSSANLPLPAASKTGCEIAYVYQASGNITSTEPAFVSGWNTEASLDIEWAHAIAPLARIVVIQSAAGSLPKSIKLAGTMGPGIVSNSWGTSYNSSLVEATSNSRLCASVYTSVDGLSLVASAGDNGYWIGAPAGCSNYVAVGGTAVEDLSDGGTGTIYKESVWSLSGGAVSSQIALPSFQSSVPGGSALSMRSGNDVSMVSSPNTGVPIYYCTSSTDCQWTIIGGTSAAAPMFAGILAIVNATRAAAGKTPLGGYVNDIMYSLASDASTYATMFSDVTSGDNANDTATSTYGTCTLCAAATGWDVPTGLGSPKGTAFVSVMAAAAIPVSRPTVSSLTVTRSYGSALFSLPVKAVARNAVTYTLSGDSASLFSISTEGIITFTSESSSNYMPSGSYSFTVTITDSITSQSASGEVSIMVN